jgi:hypothetical protein
VSPKEEYERRLRDREAVVTVYQRIHIRLGNIRLLLVIATIALVWAIIKHMPLSPRWLASPIVLFALTAMYHAGVLRKQSLAQRAVKFYQQGLARIEDRWAGTGETGERFIDPHHIYSSDLDLFGHGSLFQLLCSARTRMGESKLAEWLLAPSPIDDLRHRQAAVSEFFDKLDLREDIAVLGDDARVGINPQALMQWAEAKNQLQSRIAVGAAVLALSAIAGAAVWAVWGIKFPFFTAVIVEGFLLYLHRDAVASTLHETSQAFKDLDLLSSLLARLERETFSTARLQKLNRDLSAHSTAASQAIAQLRTLVDWSDALDNILVKWLNVPLLYSVQIACAAERWRTAHGPDVRKWLEAAAELEGLLSLSGYCYEHPNDPFPEFIEGSPAFHATQLGHPLLAAAKCVRNDVTIDADHRVTIVSGSNMSGKSTLMRAVGVNTILAMAGAPVRADSLSLTPLHLGASIQVHDSLQEGSSRFYAEITRLRQIHELATNTRGVLFLLDELLQGTNSHDRRVGAEGVIRALLSRDAIGILSTHDLALTNLALPEWPVRNLHFEDAIENGRMTFDYRLRDGVVTRSNGLALMRSIGLDV